MLDIERDARGIVTLTLDRPEAKNALSAALVARLTEALDALAGDATVRAVLLTGAGDVFCAGADVGEMRARRRRAARSRTRRTRAASPRCSSASSGSRSRRSPS